MHGIGTKRGITINRDVPVLLDVTRLISRVGYGQPTGIDRVERAYLDWCLSTDAPLFLIARVSGGYALLDRDGAVCLQQRLDGEIDWGGRDLRARVGIKTAPDRGRAESDVRRLAIRKGALSAILEPDLSPFIYLNVGHSGLISDDLAQLKEVRLSICVMLHDLIPHLYPEMQRAETVRRFNEKLGAIAQYADLVLTNSDCTMRDCKTHLRFAAPIHSVHLGITDHSADHGPTHKSTKPNFVAIGTIEPRKNYGFLLDIWEMLESTMPQVPGLHIIGRRGWADQTLLNRLDGLKSKPWFHEHNDLNDSELLQFLSQSYGLVFPTLAEGFGLPSVEAASLGVPVICGDLAIHRELLADYPVYAPLDDIYAWKQAVLDRIEEPPEAKPPRRPGPTWTEHFTIVSDILSKHTDLNQRR